MRHNSGFTFAMAGFALLTCGDAVIKSMAGLWPALAVGALRFAIAVPMLAMFISATSGPASLRVRRPWLQLGRGTALALSSGFFFISLFLMPLAEATAIVFVSPIITAILSAIFLREPLHRAAWLASAVALAGVAMVLRPNLAELGIVALLPLCAAFFFALLLILNRKAVGSGSGLALQWVIAAVAAPLLAIFAAAGHFSAIPELALSWPEGSVALRCTVVAITASASHWLIYQGTTRGNAAVAAQAVYIQLPVALLIDAVIFRHLPDAMALAGSALILGAGAMMWLGQRTRA
jgi:drug/metabolite transporter (DMT)-like permease